VLYVRKGPNFEVGPRDVIEDLKKKEKYRDQEGLNFTFDNDLPNINKREVKLQ